ncbi:MAG: hypothetical protein FWE36_05320 [Erysipelotrichales bacterium]|nr:hypothetical protein [Erysipelotrichales bacterium]
MRFVIKSIWNNEIVIGILILIAVLVIFSIIGFIIDTIVSYVRSRNNNGFRHRAQYYFVEIATELKRKEEIYSGEIKTGEKKKTVLYNFSMIKLTDNFLLAIKPEKTLNDFDLNDLSLGREVTINKQVINEYLTVIARKQYSELTEEEIINVKKLGFSFKTGIEFTVTKVLMHIAEYIN